jgi:hypothetical protein
MKAGDRVYNLHFGWGTVMMPPTTDKILVDLDAKTIDYYVMGRGRVQYHRNEETGQHPLRAPLSEFFAHPDEIPEDTATYLKKMSLSAKITL